MCQSCLDTLVFYCNCNVDMIRGLDVPVQWQLLTESLSKTKNVTVKFEAHQHYVDLECRIFLFLKAMLLKTKNLSVDIYDSDIALHNMTIRMYDTNCRYLVNELGSCNGISDKYQVNRDKYIKSLTNSIDLIRDLCTFNCKVLPCRRSACIELVPFMDIYSAFMDFQ